MKKAGENVADVMRQLRTLYEQTALLIQTADTLLGKEGWRYTTNQCVSIGTVPERATAWYPDDVFHFYACEQPQYLHLLPFVSVIFVDRDKPENIAEPLVSAGVFNYGQGNRVNNAYSLWYAHTHVWMPNRADDGSFTGTTQKATWPNWNEKFQSVSTMAIPLLTITDAEQLRQKVISPLISRIDSECMHGGSAQS
jgi:hypothetical protein